MVMSSSGADSYSLKLAPNEKLKFSAKKWHLSKVEIPYKKWKNKILIINYRARVTFLALKNNLELEERGGGGNMVPN